MARKGSTITAEDINGTVTQGAHKVAAIARELGLGVSQTAHRARQAAGTAPRSGLGARAGRLTSRAGLTRRAGSLAFKAGRKVGRAETTVKRRPVRNGAIAVGAAGALVGLAAAGVYTARHLRQREEINELNEAASVPVTMVETETAR